MVFVRLMFVCLASVLLPTAVVPSSVVRCRWEGNLVQRRKSAARGTRRFRGCFLSLSLSLFPCLSFSVSLVSISRVSICLSVYLSVCMSICLSSLSHRLFTPLFL